jgi:hypothetical protein
MRIVTIMLPLLLLASEASAISRYDVGNMSCDRVQLILGSEGAAILRWRSKRTGLTLYDRFVYSRAYCQASETTDYASVPTADDPTCAVKRCVEIEFFDDR